MKRLLVSGVTLSLFMSSTVFALNCEKMCPLNVVSFQLQSEQWASTDTAKVVVKFSGALTASGLAEVHQQINAMLAKLYKSADWHITQFQRQKDNSGLENVVALAEARLPESALPGLRSQAKAISKAGATYEIAQIEFVPSQEDIQIIKSNLRNKIYRDAKIELAQLNKLYPEQHYQLHKVEFIELPSPIMAARNDMGAAVNLMKMPQAPMNVSNKIYMQANIEFAAKMLGQVSDNKLN